MSDTRQVWKPWRANTRTAAWTGSWSGLSGGAKPSRQRYRRNAGAPVVSAGDSCVGLGIVAPCKTFDAGATVTFVGVGLLMVGTRVRDHDFEDNMARLHDSAAASEKQSALLTASNLAMAKT